MSVKDGILVMKLKEGIQETVVFLQTLAQFKIPAVMETRRKKLLDKLLLLQGDTIRDTPPSFENANGDAASPARDPVKDKEEIGRKSSVVESKVSEYSRIDTKAKEDMSQFSSPKKAVSTDKKQEEVPPPIAEGTDYLEPASVLQRREKDGERVNGERPASTVSAESGETEKPAEQPTAEDSGAAAAVGEVGKGKKKRGLRVGTGGLKALRSKMGKKSTKKGPNTSGSDITTAAAAADTDSVNLEVEEQGKTADSSSVAEKEEEKEGEQAAEEEGEKEAEEEEKGEELEEGVKILSQLEKRVPKRLGKGFNWVTISGKLKETTLILMAGSKDKELDLSGCMVSPSDAAVNGIELYSHKEQKQWVFRVETNELREKWVEELQKSIDACPVEERPPPSSTEVSTEIIKTDDKQPPPPPQQQEEKVNEDIPAIIEPTTSSNEASPVKTVAMAAPSPSRTMKNKPISEVPQQGIQIKGYVHRKKGTFGGWEKVYAVVTYAAVYFTTGEEVKGYHHVCLLNGSGTVKLEKKGHEKQAEGLLVKSGKSKETLSLPSSEMPKWKQVMEEVLGVSQGGLELGSEDEDEGAESATPIPQTQEDLGLYEELPADIEIEEDIYEEFDDVKPSPSPRAESPPPNLPPPRLEKAPPSPALPPRNASEPSPTLPPRSPSLPSRSSHAPAMKKIPDSKRKSLAPPAPPVPTQPDVGGEELYEDVVAPPTSSVANDDGEETYEDIVAPTTGADDGEELYEDVISPQNHDQDSPSEEYTEMDIGQGPPEDYVLMEKPKGGDQKEEEEDELEVYCEVDPDSPKHAPVNSLALPPKGAVKPSTTSSKITKPPPPVSYTPRQASNLGHKGPKKSKFYEEWCSVEGTNLCVYKNQKDKRASEKISLNEYDMVYTPAGKDGKFAFRLTKGDKVHQFTPSSKQELTSWMGALRGVAKSATLEVPAGQQEIYLAHTDHKAESDEQISFKSGSYIKVISRVTPDHWIGQLGSNSETFTGKIGKFPAANVSLAEDLYI